jgi:hypothetical protein
VAVTQFRNGTFDDLVLEHGVRGFQRGMKHCDVADAEISQSLGQRGFLRFPNGLK